MIFVVVDIFYFTIQTFELQLNESDRYEFHNMWLEFGWMYLLFIIVALLCVVCTYYVVTNSNGHHQLLNANTSVTLCNDEIFSRW